MKRFLLWIMAACLCGPVLAQRMTDALDRGVIAVKVNGGVYVSWRINAEDYYDVQYNLYRDGVKIAEHLNVSNYTDAAGTAGSLYTVSAVVRGMEQAQSKAAKVWSTNYLEVKMDHGSLQSVYVPNDACCADVDGDGEVEILLKFDNSSDAAASYPKGGYHGEYAIIEVYKLDGTKLWWIDLGPNMADFQNNEQNIVAYDWDGDGRAEAVMRAADGTVIHMADGTEYVIGDKTKNYRAATSSGQWFVHDGAEFLVYMDGQTGKPYQVLDYPLKRLEAGETNLETAWGDGYGHRSTKHFFGAPYLDGRHASIFLARGIYTRHKMIAYDVNPATHELTVRWRWQCNESSSPYYGQGFHNYGIADVDMDGRDEICFGGMVIDDNGKGLSSTGLGHGDAQHHGDFDPYTPGLEIYTCQEDRPSNCYRDGTTSKIRYRLSGGSDDGRSMCGNFCNDFPGAMGYSGHDTPISCVTASHVDGLTSSGVTLNFRIYWDGDLCEESFNGTATRNSEGAIYKHRVGLIESLTGSLTNNDTKATPSYQGDVFGDWREEVIMRTAANNIRIYTTKEPTPWRNYSLWHDHQYRQAMVWQMCGYNQPPHASYFLGEMEGITIAPPPLTMTGRDEVTDGGTISHADRHVILCETGNAAVTVSDGAAPYIFTDNTPSWVQGTGSTSTINPRINYEYYTHTLSGGAFTGAMRLVKQGDGTLVLPNVTETYTGPTDIWGGTLQFDGTMQGSRVWLNRHTTLVSNGGRFMQGLQADYNATIQPGGNGAVGTVSFSTLSLGFGSRIVFDVQDAATADQVNADVLKIEKKTWTAGPKYDVPVFQFQGTVAAGRYLLGHVGTIEGNLSDVCIEGLSLQKTSLSHENGELWLTVVDYQPGRVSWMGSVDGVWDLDATANFADAEGQPINFVPQDEVVFNDAANRYDVTVRGVVSPASITFNHTKSYTLSGDSLRMEPALTKDGTGSLIINSQNHLGNTVINGGVLAVNSLANYIGNDYGSLGDVKKTITVNNHATLSVSESTTNSQTVYVGEGGAVLNVVNGKTLKMDNYNTSADFVAAGGTELVKTGQGTLQSAGFKGIKRLIIQQGTVNATEASGVTQLPDTVEFQGGTLSDPNNVYSTTTNRTNFYVPEGKTGTFNADGRCTYTGSLTGSGTFNVNATYVRCYFNGDWSEFEGTIVPGLFKTDSYDPSFDFRSTKGLPKATLQLASDFTFNNGGTDMAIGRVTGTGTLAGSGRYYLGQSNQSFSFTGYCSSPITKRGTGYMNITAGHCTAPIIVESGELRFTNTTSDPVIGSNSITLRDSGAVAGSGLVNSLLMYTGTRLTPRGRIATSPGTLTTRALLRVDKGATVCFLVSSNTRYSSLAPQMLTLNGTVTLQLLDGYTPAIGDELTLWTVNGTFSGTPTFDLPQLPAGMAWDTTGLLQKNGVLRIVAESNSISSLPADGPVECEVYAASGVQVATLTTTPAQLEADLHRQHLPKGTYIIKVRARGTVVTLKKFL